jgi:signal transduction histidine kinase
MEPARDRRRGPGRRLADRAWPDSEPLAVRGLLHDLVLQVTTLSYLVEAVRGETGLPGDAQQRLELLTREMSRLLDLVAGEFAGMHSAAEVSPFELKSLALQVAQVAGVRHTASVVVLPGPDLTVEASPLLLWRVLTNVVENAARATGPRGRVEIRFRDQQGPVIEVADDGPGFGHGPSGRASLGLSVVTSLLDTCGGSLEVQSPHAGGTLVSIRLPAAGTG